MATAYAQVQREKAGTNLSERERFCEAAVMSKTEGFLILDSQDAALIGDKGEKTVGPCPQIVARRKLADISNLPQNPRLIQHEKSESIPTNTKEYIEKLQKDNMALVKMLAQRNKIIEQSGIELERLRLNLIKMQEQNQQLAQSHTQMLAELNSGKDRMKALQHELGCKNGLLKARKLDLQDKSNTRPCQPRDVEVNLSKLQEKGESSKDARNDEKPRNTRRRLRSHSLGSSETLQSEEKGGNKRSLLRRQSARFKDAEKLFGAVDTEFSKCPLPEKSASENGSTSLNASVENEDNRSSSSSLCRPARQAAKKVQSYKEIPLNVKMRRSG